MRSARAENFRIRTPAHGDGSSGPLPLSKCRERVSPRLSAKCSNVWPQAGMTLRLCPEFRKGQDSEALWRDGWSKGQSQLPKGKPTLHRETSHAAEHRCSAASQLWRFL